MDSRFLVALLGFAGCASPGAEDEGSDEGISTEDSSTTIWTTSGTSTQWTTESDDGDDSTTSSDGLCYQWSASHPPPNVMFVVDTSGSMVAQTWDHDADPGTPEVSRWTGVHGALDSVFADPPVAIHAGLQRFPSVDACPNAMPGDSNCYDADACVVADEPEVGLAPLDAAALLAGIPPANADDVEIAGATPTTAAFLASRDHLVSTAEGPSQVVMITDGAANCDDALGFPAALETHDVELAIAVAAAFAEDAIPTFVIGIDVDDGITGVGDDAEPELDLFATLGELATAGGVPNQIGPANFFDARDGIELVEILDSILLGLRDCTIDLSENPGGLPSPVLIPYIQLLRLGDEVPFVADCEAESGWTWIVAGEVIAVCGSFCEEFGAGGELDVECSCPGGGD